MTTEEEDKLKELVELCIESFDSTAAAIRIVSFIKADRDILRQKIELENKFK